MAWIIQTESRMIEYKLQTYFILAAERNTFAMYGGTIFDRVYKGNHFKRKSCADKHSAILNMYL